MRCRDDRLLVEEEEEEACMRVILQQQSVKAGCELIVLLMTGLLKNSSTGRKRSRADESGASHTHCSTHLLVPGWAPARWIQTG